MTDQASHQSAQALIIEDHPDTANLFALALSLVGFETEIIDDGAAALARLSRAKPDVITLDLHLPNASGDDILRQIRADDRLSQTRVMLTTADPMRAEKLRSQSDLVLIKPIAFAQIRDLASRLHPANSR